MTLEIFNNGHEDNNEHLILSRRNSCCSPLIKTNNHTLRNYTPEKTKKSSNVAQRNSDRLRSMSMNEHIMKYPKINPSQNKRCYKSNNNFLNEYEKHYHHHHASYNSSTANAEEEKKSQSDANLYVIFSQEHERFKEASERYQELLNRMALLKNKKLELLKAANHIEKQQEAASIRHHLAMERRKLWDKYAQLQQQQIIRAQEQVAQIRQSLQTACLQSKKKSLQGRTERANAMRSASDIAKGNAEKQAFEDLQRRRALHDKIRYEHKQQKILIEMHKNHRIDIGKEYLRNRLFQEETKVKKMMRSIYKAELKKSTLLDQLSQIQRKLEKLSSPLTSSSLLSSCVELYN